jgi:hypothetical protein
MISIVEKHPDGNNSVKSILSWIDDVDTRAADARGVWKMLIPDLKQAVKYEFSDANPNDWPALSDDYREQKISEGWPATIGVRTGGLKKAASDEAKIKMTQNALSWGVDETVFNAEGEAVGNYAHDFHENRPLFGFTAKYINESIDEAIMNWITTG